MVSNGHNVKKIANRRIHVKNKNEALTTQAAIDHWMVEPMSDKPQPANEGGLDTIQPVRPSSCWPLDPTAQPFQPKTLQTEPKSKPDSETETMPLQEPEKPNPGS